MVLNYPQRVQLLVLNHPQRVQLLRQASFLFSTPEVAIY